MSLISTADPAAGTSSSRSVSAFVALAKSGASGTFDEVYQVEGPNRGTIEIAQLVPQRPFNAGSGRWSFVYQTQTGISSQWIEEGSTSWDCWHFAGVTAWTCSGPGHFELSNGFIGSVEPYIPGLVLGEVTQLQQAGQLKPDPVKSIAFYGSKSTAFGRLRCLRVEATGVGTVTICLDHRGVLVTQRGGSRWRSITLLRYRSGVPNSAFVLKGKSTSSGQNFAAVPS